MVEGDLLATGVSWHKGHSSQFRELDNNILQYEMFNKFFERPASGTVLWPMTEAWSGVKLFKMYEVIFHHHIKCFVFKIWL